MIAFWRLHSLSIVLACAFALCTVISLWVTYGTWAADFWLGWSAGFGVVLIQILASKWTWEKDADPAKPPS